MDTHQKPHPPNNAVIWEKKARLYTVPRGKSHRVIVNLPANCGLAQGEYYVRIYADTPVDTPPQNPILEDLVKRFVLMMVENGVTSDRVTEAEILPYVEALQAEGTL